MTLKPKTVRRLLLLGAVAVLLVGGGLGFLVVRRVQSQRLDARLLAEGTGAFEREDYPGAMSSLGRLLKRQGDRLDPDALLLYARARARLVEPDGTHVREGLGAFKLYLSIRPGDREAELELLRLYIASRQLPEARDAAARLRPADLKLAVEADLPVLREEMRVLLAIGTYDDRLRDVARRITEVSPLDLDAQITYCDCLARRGMVREAREWAEAFRAAHPSDPRARLVALLIGLGPPDAAEVERLFEGLCALTGLDARDPESPPTGGLPDETYVLRVATLFDQIGRHDHAAAILRAAAELGDMPGAFRLGVRRGWQAGRDDWVIRATDQLSASDRAVPAESLGFRAMALRGAGRTGEAEAIIAALKGRASDYSARAWAESLGAPDRPVLGASEAYARAVHEGPGEPVFRHLLAGSMSAMGRLEEAIGEWRAAAESPLSMGWALPWVRMSAASLELGLVGDAVEQAERAAAISPRSVAAASARFAALVAKVERSASPTGDEGALIEFAERASEELRMIDDRAAGARFIEGLLPGRVLLLSRLGRRDEATALIDGCLSASPPPERQTLERLAMISIREGLGRDGALLDSAVRLHGDAPSIGAVRALRLHQDGKDAQAVQMLDEAVLRAAPDRRAAWEAARAAFLDGIGDPRAGAAWAAVADANPGDLAVQSAALRSPSAARDASFVDRAAARVAMLSGVPDPHSSVVRLARARALLAGRPTLLQRDEAVGLVRTVTVDQPRLVEARLLLADALLVEDAPAGIRADIPGALVELRAAAEASVDKAPVWLRVAALQQRQRDFPGAHRELLRLARDYPDRLEIRRAAADLLVAQGAVGDAISIYRSVAEASGAARDAVALAEACALDRRDADALAILRPLAGKPPESADQALGVAVWLHRLGDSGAADRAIAALDDLTITHDQRELYLGRFEAERNNAPKAAEHLRASVAANPGNADAWLRLVSLHAARGDMEAAGTAAREARGALPDDPRLVVVERQIAASAGAESSDVDAFAAALSTDPGGSRSADGVRAVSEGLRSGRLDAEGGIVALADRFRDDLAVQNFAARRLLTLSPARPEAAARIAERTMSAFPTAPEPARAAAAAHAAMGRWDRMLACAEAWRSRDPRRPVEADAAVAEAHLGLGAPDRAWAVLAPRLDQLKSTPGAPEFVPAAGVAAKALIALSRPEEAFELLAPALPVSATVRNAILIPIALGQIESTAIARDWLDRSADAFPDQPPSERAALAMAYARLALRPDAPRAELISAAESVLESPGTPALDAAVLEARGAIAEAQGRPAEAVDLYRRALERDAGRIGVLTRLADVAGESGVDPGVVLAAVGASGTSARDPGTLLAVARVYHTVGDRREGETSSQALERALGFYRRVLDSNPDDVEVLLRAAQASDRLGDAPGAVDYYSRALALPRLTGEDRAVVQNNAAYLLLGRKGASDLRRARALAQDAVGFARRAAFLDTLARIEMASGERARAGTLFREAVRSEPAHVGARLGLAEVLADGTSEERAEAARFVQGLLAEPQRLSEEQTRVLADLRARVNLEK